MKTAVWGRTGELIEFKDLTTEELNTIWSEGPSHVDYKHVHLVDKTLNDPATLYSSWNTTDLVTSVGTTDLFSELYEVCLEAYEIESMPA